MGKYQIVSILLKLLKYLLKITIIHILILIFAAYTNCVPYMLKETLKKYILTFYRNESKYLLCPLL